MKASRGATGRVFVIRLHDGDTLPDCIEKFAHSEGISAGMCILIGGIEGGSIVAGPEDAESRPVNRILVGLEGVHEVFGVGTLFPDAGGMPRLHMHASFGRRETSLCGCIRPGIDVWKIAEVILLEIEVPGARRVADRSTGFEVLEP